VCLRSSEVVKEVYCKKNTSIDSDTSTPPTVRFEKLSFNRDENKIEIIIQNTGKEVVKELTLRCTNISKNQESLQKVLLNKTLKTTTTPILELPASSSSSPIDIAIDFQDANEADVQVEIVGGQQVLGTQSIPINKYPLNLLPIGSTILVATQGEPKEFKWKLVKDSPAIDFNKFQLEVDKPADEDITVSVAGTPIALNQSTNSQTLSGADLEKLAQQGELLVTVINNTTTDPIFITCTLSTNDTGSSKRIAKIENSLYQNITTDLLIKAVRAGDIETVKLAMEKGVDVNVADKFNRIALVEAPSKEIVELLIKNKADVHAKNNTGMTVLHKAAQNGHKEIVEALLRNGVKPMKKTIMAVQLYIMLLGKEIKKLFNY